MRENERENCNTFPTDKTVLDLSRLTPRVARHEPETAPTRAGLEARPEPTALAAATLTPTGPRLPLGLSAQTPRAGRAAALGGGEAESRRTRGSWPGAAAPPRPGNATREAVAPLSVSPHTSWGPPFLAAPSGVGGAGPRGPADRHTRAEGSRAPRSNAACTWGQAGLGSLGGSRAGCWQIPLANVRAELAGGNHLLGSSRTFTELSEY